MNNLRINDTFFSVDGNVVVSIIDSDGIVASGESTNIRFATEAAFRRYAEKAVFGIAKTLLVQRNRELEGV